jgi:hypothetical protein
LALPPRPQVRAIYIIKREPHLLIALLETIYCATSSANTSPAARGSLARAGVRTYATVQDTPVRHYGGLKDQDRIFTNLYSRHDHGIKGAMVRLQNQCDFVMHSLRCDRLVATGIALETLF